MKKALWIWRRHIPVEQSELWLEKLAWTDLDRVVILSRPGTSRARVEVHGSDRVEIRQLLENHGGRHHRLHKNDWLPPVKAAPVRVQRDLYVVPDRETGRQLHKKIPQVRTLLIPAGMAFGSGGHATTGMILRRLGGMGRAIESATILDLGTGSGILALAARALGAKKIAAMDNCPDCIRIARENEKANFSRPQIRWTRAELGAFAPTGRFTLVTANLFSELLISHAARLERLVTPGGVLLLSGILRHQAAGVIRACRKTGLILSRQRRRGKWVMLEFTKKA